MNFILENVRNGVSRFLDEHETAIKFSEGVPIYQRLVDDDRKVLFYCLSVGGGPDGDDFPGVYVLFIDGRSYLLNIGLKRFWQDTVGNVANYHVEKVEGINFLVEENEGFRSILKGALQAWEKILPNKSVITNVECTQGSVGILSKI
ncbi:hypothetical protein [Seonamhaeicola sp.]|uniref:hypothetical protein n=1 Tax=Seonamhaeicola sp. TaxID=1912245 RepID=UPI00262EDF13|nr:hypothetical protein [Seonamhaeicola sp.]